MKLVAALAHLFIPRSSNNHKAKVLHLASLNLITALLILSQMALSSVGYVKPDVLGYAANISPDEVVRLTNERRVAAGLSPVVLNPTLSTAAQAKANDMIARDYWAHVAPDGTEPWKFFKDVGYRYKYAGENLARDFSNPGSTVEAWMASPSHRENMLSPKYREIGVAVAEGDMNGVDTTVVVQLFGTRFTDSNPSVTTAGVQTTAAAKPSSSPEAVIAQVTPTSISEPKVLVSPFTVTRGVSLAIIGVLMAVLVLDGMVITRRKISRVGGRTWAHVAFMAVILVILVVARAGHIL